MSRGGFKLWDFDVVRVYQTVSFKLAMGRQIAYHKNAFLSRKGHKNRSGGRGGHSGDLERRRLLRRHARDLVLSVAGWLMTKRDREEQVTPLTRSWRREKGVLRVESGTSGRRWDRESKHLNWIQVFLAVCEGKGGFIEQPWGSCGVVRV